MYDTETERKVKVLLNDAGLCPYCFGDLGSFPSVSRVDNATEICTDCGRREALAGITRPSPPLP